MKHLSLVLMALLTFNVYAANDLGQEMDALGANKELMKKARAVDPDNRVRVVQNREVDRNYRFEIGANYGVNGYGGDSFVNTSMLSGQLDFHLTPRWSLGARYTSYSNSLTNEGNNAFNTYSQQVANNEQGARAPSIAYANNSYLGVIDFYPIYGKMNIFDAAVAQFDLYLLGGAGQINLNTGSAPLYTAGGGFAVWLSKHVATRFEARWQGYTEQSYNGVAYTPQSVNELVLSAGISFLL